MNKGLGGVNPISRTIERLSGAWEAVQDKTSAWTMDPFTELQAMGEYTVAGAESQWQQIRQSYNRARIGANAVIGILETPCEDKWSVALRLARPALGQAFMLLLDMQPEEVVENYLQPKRERTRKRRRRDTDRIRRGTTIAGRVRRKFPDVPDVDHATSRLIPGGQWVQGRKVGIGEIVIFEAIDRADRLAWWFLVFEVGSEFWYQWSSNMIESRFCSAAASDFWSLQQSFDSFSGGSKPLYGDISELGTFDANGWDAFADSDITLLKFNDTQGTLVWSATANITNNTETTLNAQFGIIARGFNGGTIVKTITENSEVIVMQPGQTRSFNLGINSEYEGIDRISLDVTTTAASESSPMFTNHQIGWWGNRDT